MATRRAMARRSREAGFTLIELLLSLALLAVLTGFVIGSLSLAKRAFALDAANAAVAEADEEVRSLMNLLASAIPVLKSDQRIAFDGRAGSLSFVALSEGHALRGGPHSINLQLIDHELMVEVGKWPMTAATTPPDRSRWTTAVRRIRAVRFAYFGTMGESGAEPRWRSEWAGARALPQLISIQIEFEDSSKNAPAVMVALRNG